MKIKKVNGAKVVKKGLPVAGYGVRILPLNLTQKSCGQKENKSLITIYGKTCNP